MALSIMEGAERIGKWAENLEREVPRRGVKAVATRFKHTVKAQQTTKVFRNFGGTGKSHIGTGAHFKLSGSGSDAAATVTTYGPFDILETGAARHVILPVGGRGVLRSGRTRTRRGAEGAVRRRLEKGKGFRSLQGGPVTQQNALKFPDGGFAPYTHHPGTRPKHPWKKSVAVIGPQATRIYERSVLIGMAKVGLR